MQKNKITGILTSSIVIPVYNSKDLLLRTLPSVVKAQEHKQNQIKEIIVVDDASTDGSAAYIKKKFKGVRIIKHTKHRGFAASVNTGARTASGKLLVVLTSDIIPNVNFLSSVLHNFEKPEIFAVSLNEKGRPRIVGYFDKGFIVDKEWKGKTKLSDTFWVRGESAVYRRDYWMRLGGLDDKLFSPYYWEDFDLSYRAAKRGFVNLWDPAGKVGRDRVVVDKKINKRKASAIYERNHLLIHWKNITSRHMFRKHIAGLFKRMIKHPGYIRIFLFALLRLRSVMNDRKKEIKESKISDEALLTRFKDS